MTLRRVYVDGPHGQLHLRIAGDGAPLLLLHQSPLSGDQFSAALPLLAEAGFCAVAMDTPGFGQSDRPTEPVGISGYADAIPAVLAAMGWSKTHVLGHHTGASIAASLAARRPELVDRLVLNGVALLSDEERAHFAQFRFAPLEPQADGSHLLAAWNQRLAASPGWSNLEAMHRYVTALLAKPADYFWGFEAAFAHDMAADLAAITAPTLIFSNTGEDLYAASQRAHALRPDFAFAALQGGTHDIIDEQPEAWAAAVTAFLRG
ncbi:MAG: alpha/beta hydrolase [Brevundimonas sp.]|nr:alpha/beta hydrolase [Brevundimonas sp.]